MSEPIKPEIDGFEEKVGQLVLRDHDIGGQKAVIDIEFPVEKETGISPHEELISDIEEVVQKHYSE